MDRNNVTHYLRNTGRWLFTAITVGFILPFKVFAFENGYTYFKKQENHTEIDWEREALVKYLLFLTASAIDNRMLNELVTQYADVLGARMINIYRHTSECQ